MAMREIEVGDFVNFDGDPAIVIGIRLSSPVPPRTLVFAKIEHLMPYYVDLNGVTRLRSGSTTHLLIEYRSEPCNRHVCSRILNSWWRYMNYES